MSTRQDINKAIGYAIRYYEVDSCDEDDALDIAYDEFDINKDELTPLERCYINDEFEKGIEDYRDEDEDEDD